MPQEGSTGGVGRGGAQGTLPLWTRCGEGGVVGDACPPAVDAAEPEPTAVGSLQTAGGRGCGLDGDGGTAVAGGRRGEGDGVSLDHSVGDDVGFAGG